MSHLSLQLLGPFRATLDDKPLTGFGSSKVKALLAYLAMESNRPKRRDTLAGWFWPAISQHSAMENLRYALSDLRKQIGDRQSESTPWLQVSRERFQLTPSSNFYLDVTAFDQQFRQATESPGPGEAQEQTALRCLEAAAALYQGEFLEDFSLGDNTPFDDWALFQRSRYHQKILWVLKRLADLYTKRAQYELAQAHAMRQLEIEPSSEDAHRQLMRVLALSGQRTAALKQYQTCCRLLQDDLEVEPDQETRRLYEAIRDGKLDRELENGI